MSNDSLAVNYLRYWYNASNIADSTDPDFVSYPDVLAKFRTEHPTFLPQLSQALATIRQDKVQRAFEALAKKDPDIIPSVSDFFNSLADEMTSVNFANISDAVEAGVAQTAKQVGAVAAFGLGTYALVLVGASLIFILPLLKGRIKGAFI